MNRQGWCTLTRSRPHGKPRLLPQAALDQWIVDGSVELQDGDLTVLSAGRQYKLAEAVHVLRDVSGTEDAHELVGLVKAKTYLEQLGAELVETSMLIGDSAYDVEPGWLGIPVGAFSDFVPVGRLQGRPAARAGRPSRQTKKKSSESCSERDRLAFAARS